MKKLFILALVAITVGGCGGSDCSGLQCKVLHFEALYTTAPAAINIRAGETRDFAIGGGTSPYNATSSDLKILTSLVDGYTLKIAGISGGQGTVAIVDTAGNRITLNVTVGEKGVQTNPPPTGSVIPDGLFAGSTSTGRTATGLVLEDGSYYVLYSAQYNPSLIAGAVQGTGSALNGSFASTNAKDINLEGLGLLSGSLSASFTTKQSLNGKFTYSSLNQSLTFTSAYDSHYDIAPAIASIAGTYTGRVGSTDGVENATISITNIGTVTGVGSSGCKLSGMTSPRPRGNAYNVSITFGGSPCRLPEVSLSGAAYFDAATKRIYAVAMNLSRNEGLVYAGTKL